MFLNRTRNVISSTPEGKKSGFTNIKINSSDFVLSQISIVASCNIVDEHVITPATVEYINENHNAWSNEDMKKYYKSFIGGHNFLEHEQNEKKSYGFIADATLRKKEVNDDEFIYSVELLIATAKKNTPNDKIAKKISDDKQASFSMGCMSSAIKCSYCGHVSVNEDDDCKHIKNQLGKQFATNDGGLSEIAMIVSDATTDSTKGYITFIEASVVSNPAYVGAVLGYVLDIEDNKDIYLKIPNENLNRPTYNGIKTWQSKNMITVLK